MIQERGLIRQWPGDMIPHVAAMERRRFRGFNTMACFTAPLAEALVVSAAKSASKGADASRNPFVRRLGWLRNMLFGGSFLLAVEHVWHGEITWRYPFLTAVAEGDTAGMLREIATVGVAMAVLVTVAWACMVVVSESAARRAARAGERL